MAPRLLDFDAGEGVLVTGALDGYVPLDRQLKHVSRVASDAAMAAASALARIHQPIDEGTAVSGDRVAFPLESIEPLTPYQLAARPADYSLVLPLLEESSEQIELLSSGWRHSAFIHGDFKADNLLLQVGRKHREQPPLMIVDWEMAGLGDPLWDVGSYLGSVVLAWMRGLARGSGRAHMLEGQEANGLRRQCGYFLITYRHLAPAIFASTGSFCLKALEYAGIFLLHRVFVTLSFTGFLDSAAWLMLELARSFLNSPERVAAALWIDSVA